MVGVVAGFAVGGLVTASSGKRTSRSLLAYPMSSTRKSLGLDEEGDDIPDIWLEVGLEGTLLVGLIVRVVIIDPDP